MIKIQKARFASFSSDVARLETDEPVQQALVRNIQANTQSLRASFPLLEVITS